MNKSALRSYAPQARRDFIAAVTARANLLGLSSASISDADVRGDVAIIEGREWPAKVAKQRDALVARIKKDGFEQTMEAVAYTWFNRFAALRYMEVHDYLDHGYRVLSARDGGLPEVLRHASELNLSSLDKAEVMEMQLAGNRDSDLYRKILLAECNELSRAMPFLFERIDDETELLLPDNLLRTDSIVAKLVSAIDEQDWAEVEIIGWLYQFYIAERKDEVIGKVVRSEDIPAATQLFTPNWIVKFLVQNSVGRLWITTNPDSKMAEQWKYYVATAEQQPEVQAQLDSLIHMRMFESGGSLDPESLTVLDPACGSGHILVEAYDLLKDIYLERGYQSRAIPRLILEKNLHGIDIDDRAAQLAAFALLMKARADDRRLLDRPPDLHVIALQESKNWNLDEAVTNLSTFGIRRESLTKLRDTFSHAKTFGSLIQIPSELSAELGTMLKSVEEALERGDLYARLAANDILPLIRQALILEKSFDAVIANPPYMGARYYSGTLKELVDTHYRTAKGDLYACFMVRSTLFARRGATIGMITIPNWTFLSTFEDLRNWLFTESTIEAFSHNGRGVFGSDFGSCAFTFRNYAIPKFKGRYMRLFGKQGGVSSNDELAEAFGKAISFNASTADFRVIPGSPISYWVSKRMRDVFAVGSQMGEIVDARQGLATGDNAVFLRLWHEVGLDRIGFGMKNRTEALESGNKWFPYNKGGEFRKWYGNQEYVVNWEDDGRDLLQFRPRSVIRNPDYYFGEAVSWSDITIAENAFRYIPHGFINDSTGHSVFNLGNRRNVLLSLCNNRFASEMLKVLNPGVHFHIGYFNRLPYPERLEGRDLSIIDELIHIAKLDWDSFETSWDFTALPLIPDQGAVGLLEDSWSCWSNHVAAQIDRTRELEERNNRLFIEAYDLEEELSPIVSNDQITLTRADRERDSQRLISYIIGCMMGRYSLDAPGLIYAHIDNVAFDISRYNTFPADPDGIVPIMNERWFEDDAASRVREFLRVVWGGRTLDENMAWLAGNLSAKKGETSEETIGRYLADKFYSDHLQTYKRRPIYWLFTSGKQRAFQGLVYLHRYDEGTLSRMRGQYVVPLMGKMVSRIDLLQKDEDASTSAAPRTRIRKQIESLKKKHAELLVFDERLRHYADMRIKLDLDDGVKVNYAKFDDLVAESKKITGGSDD